MSQGLITAAYIIAAILFIASLNGLSSQESAKRGNIFGIIGMIVAIIATSPAHKLQAWVTLPWPWQLAQGSGFV